MFEVLADPGTHASIDGTGWVQESLDQEPQTEVTHNYDWSAVPAYIRARGIQFPPFGPDHLINSLRHLATISA